VLAGVEALVGGVDDDGVLGQTGRRERRGDAADAIIHGFHAPKVVLEIKLIFPADEIAAFELEFSEVGIAFGEARILGIASADLQVGVHGHVAVDLHFLVARG